MKNKSFTIVKNYFFLGQWPKWQSKKDSELRRDQGHTKIKLCTETISENKKERFSHTMEMKKARMSKGWRLNRIRTHTQVSGPEMGEISQQEVILKQ